MNYSVHKWVPIYNEQKMTSNLELMQKTICIRTRVIIKVCKNNVYPDTFYIKKSLKIPKG
jgi:hypothetical protein